MQRSGTTGTLAIAGTISVGGAHDVEARYRGGAWATIDAAAVGTFSGTLANQPQGQGNLEVRLADVPASVYIVYTVGIGDVYAIAGQSNAVGQGNSLQCYSHQALRAALFGNDYTWKELIDPVDSAVGQVDAVSQDAPVAGSYWPLLATALMAATGVPVAFIPCALGGSSIASWQPGVDHQDRTTLYGSMVYRALQVGGIRAVLWHQGEADAQGSTPQAIYNAYLDTLSSALDADLGAPLRTCQLQHCTVIPAPDQAAINAAIAEAWGDNPLTPPGPDLRGLTTDDGLHLKTDANLQAAATLWAAVL